MKNLLRILCFILSAAIVTWIMFGPPSQLYEAMSVAWQKWDDEANGVHGGTQWSAVFNLTSPSARYFWHRDGSSYEFTFEN